MKMICKETGVHLVLHAGCQSIRCSYSFFPSRLQRNLVGHISPCMLLKNKQKSWHKQRSEFIQFTAFARWCVIAASFLQLFKTICTIILLCSSENETRMDEGRGGRRQATGIVVWWVSARCCPGEDAVERCYVCTIDGVQLCL